MFAALDSLLTEFDISLAQVDSLFEGSRNDDVPGIEYQKKYLEILRTQLQG
jgi:hypothetical protein